jgi:dihydroflavonol-4-reductase
MKIFMTGATGFVGSFLAEALLRKDHSVKCLVRKESNLRWIADLDIECYYGSLFDLDSIKRGIEGCEIVIHVAGVTKAANETDYFKANYEGTKNLVDVCVKNRNKIKRFINISSQAAVGPSPTIIPIDESHIANPLTYYGKSKLAGEQYVMQASDKLPVTNLRPPAVYGPRETDILEFFRTVKIGIMPQLGGTDKYLSLIHVRDLVRGIIMAMDSPKTIGNTYFLTSSKPYSWSEVSRATLNVLGKKGVKIPVPLGLLKGISVLSEGIATLTKKPALINKQKIIEIEQNYWTCSPDKAYKDFGFQSEIELDEGIGETIAWYKENKWM